MGKKEFLCARCKKVENKEVVLIEKDDMLICPECKTALIIEGKSPLGRYLDTWKKNAEEIFPLIRPPFLQGDISSLRLFFLYEDCYYSLLIGRYNASIVLMGVLLEALMKERIWLKTGENFQKPYSPCLTKIEKEKLMDCYDIAFLRRFKDKIRNVYQHADIEKIVRDSGFVKAFPIKIDFSKSVLPQLEEGIKNVIAGKVKPELKAPTNPAFRDIAKQSHDKNRAIALFNQVYDFLLCANFKYFKQRDYEEFHKKFG